MTSASSPSSRPASGRSSIRGGIRRHRRTLPPPTGQALLAVPDRLQLLAERQHGVLTRDQLRRGGVTEHHIRAAGAARRWQTIGRAVVVLHNAELTHEQRQWVAVLIPGKVCALAGLSAATAAGLRGFAPRRIHIVVPHDTHAALPRWVRLHESRRFGCADVLRRGAAPRTRVARSLIDGAAWSDRPRRACAILCAGVQQRLTTPARLADELAAAGRVRHCRIMRAIVGDISGGGHTLAEIDLGPLAAAAGLPAPRRQVLRRERHGKIRYLDVEFDLPDGSLLVVEVDGAGHLWPKNWWDDAFRHNEVVIGGRIVLRFPSVMVRLDGPGVTDQLRRLRLAHRG